jgi:hypothetical protein
MYQLGKNIFGKSPIAMVPSEGYTARDNFSRSSIQWLEWTMAKETEKKKKHVRIRHALNGGEHRVSGIRRIYYIRLKITSNSVRIRY